MPRILVTAASLDEADPGVMLDERVATSDLSSDHFAAQLIERIGWALADAENTANTANTAHQFLNHREVARGGALADMLLRAS